MCGIAGVFEYRSDGEPDLRMVGRMLDAIIHRGPDDSGIHRDRGVAIGARRLSIIDLPGGHQPVVNEDGTVAVAFNGEIYNYRELRERLIRNGHTLRTHGDTEVLVHLYEELGDRFMAELRGMFAFALWDAKQRRLLVARDRLGIKPLYWWDDGARVIFGSEIKSILHHDKVTPEMDASALAAFMLLRYVPTPKTMFAGIASLPPGHLLSCDANGVRIRPWWQLEFGGDDSKLSEQDAIEVLRIKLADAVESHLVSDVPYGAFLSGGIDSSTVVALMARHLGRPVSTFAVGYRGSGEHMSELPYAKLVADRYQTDHHEVLIDAEDLVEHAADVVWHLDQPLGDDACLPNYMVSRLARQHVKMVLTGEGGDELFGGYARYAAEKRFAPFGSRLPVGARKLSQRLSQAMPGMSRLNVALYALAQADEATRIAMYTPLFHPEMRNELAIGDFASICARSGPDSLLASTVVENPATERLDRLMYVDTQHWLPDYLLLRGDKTSMATSLEARVPLLDHHLVEFAAQVPAGLKIKGPRQTRKYLLRQVARDLLPEPILSRTKKGFPVPLGAWLREGAREFCRDLLSPDAVTRRGLFSPSGIETLITQHESGTADHGSLLWGLISIELWHQLYIDRAHTFGDIETDAARA